MPVVGATRASVDPPRHALMSPFSVAKMNNAGASVVGSADVPIRKLPETFPKTAPVGPPRTFTVSGTFAPAPVYSVDLLLLGSGPLSATHHGVVGPRARPQPLTRSGSVSGAAPGMSETSGVTV